MGDLHLLGADHQAQDITPGVLSIPLQADLPALGKLEAKQKDKKVAYMYMYGSD